MKPINTIPIEDFLDKTRIATKSNQKFITIDIKDAVSLSESLSILMSRFIGLQDKKIAVAKEPSNPVIGMDGGKF